VTEVVIAGSGRCGMHTARILAERGVSTTVVERLPQTGGQEPEADARQLERAARRAGVDIVLGTLVVSHQDGVVETLGIDGARRMDVRALVLATGTRPHTRAELAISGDRGAGVTPGSAALHFLDSGLLLGYRPLVVGHGSLARHLTGLLIEKGADEVVSVADGVRRGDWHSRVRRLDGARVTAVAGFPRIRSATVRSAEGDVEIETDAVILASGRVPMRNVEGAVFAGGDVFDCFADDDPKLDAAAVRVANHTAQEVINSFH
jgi:2-polyprenyl-6-methoxyphenol hydroxylase-like FAD-dependent oxidoreductase